MWEYKHSSDIVKGRQAGHATFRKKRTGEQCSVGKGMTSCELRKISIDGWPWRCETHWQGAFHFTLHISQTWYTIWLSAPMKTRRVTSPIMNEKGRSLQIFDQILGLGHRGFPLISISLNRNKVINRNFYGRTPFFLWILNPILKRDSKLRPKWTFWAQQTAAYPKNFSRC